MKKLKKPAVLALLAVVLLSCMPERVQAVTRIEKDKHTVPEKHGDTMFENEDTQHVSYNSNRIEFQGDKLKWNFYLENPVDYVVVRYPGYDREFIIFITGDDDSFQPYVVYDGYDGSRANAGTREPVEYDGKKYIIYKTYVGNDAPEFLYKHAVITLPDNCSNEQLIEYLVTGDFSDCRVSEGDSDNPAQNLPGGMEGSEENPVYDKELGRLQLLMRGIQHKNDIWSIISGAEEIYDNIRWKKTTSTGFNVVDNDYPFCRVQVKIKCEINKTEGTASDGIHGGESKPLKNSMKEEYMYKPMPKASSQLLTVAYSDISLSYFPKLMEEYKKEKPLVDSLDTSTMKLHYYLRVIVSDSLTVVPGQKSWKCGDWVDVTAELTDKGGTSSEPGHFDEDGDWVSDGDAEEVDTVITSGDETGEEAAEKQEEKLKEEKEKYDTDDIKSLLSQVGDFPKLIKKLFSFLPGWCLTLFAFGFGCMIILLLIKAVRG